MTVYVAPIVEGHTEVACLERLLHRVWLELPTALNRIHVLPPSRGNRSSLARVGNPELETKVNEGGATLRRRLSREADSSGFILLLLDADDDCPARLGPELLARASAIRPDIHIACVLANRQFENWFKAAAGSLAGVGKLPADLVAVADPESGRGAAWLTEQMKRLDSKSEYKKPGDALLLTQRMDLALCRANSPSFARLCRELAARVPVPPAAPVPGVPA